MNHRQSDILRRFPGFALAVAVVSCGNSPDAPPAPAPTPASPPETATPAPAGKTPPREEAGIAIHKFPTAGAALQYILEKSDPLIVGFGEFHQHNATVQIRSALERFSSALLPVIAGRTSDLVVETWVSAGNCGKAEKRVTRDVDKVSRRPAATESETVKLIKKATSLGVQPHVLKLGCKDYEALQGDGGVDYLALLELVGKRLGETAKKAVLWRDARRAESAKKESSGAGAGRRTVAIYGGAIHNDAAPKEMWKSVTFGTDLKQFAGNRYVEIDLLVPEFVESSDTAKQEKWYPLFEKEVSADRTLVIELGDNAFVIVFRKGVRNSG